MSLNTTVRKPLDRHGMKLLEVFRMLNEADFLIERDILNAKELKQWANTTAERVQTPQAKAWFAGQLFKYLINRYQEGARPLMDVPSDAPEWLTAKIQAGEPVLNVEPQQELRQQAEGVIDWLNATPDTNLRMTWEDAVEAQAEWHSEIKRATRVTKLTPEQMEGLVTIKEYDGYKWVDVQTEICLQHEGTMMGHCVGQGGYTEGVSDSLTKILSLRDSKGLAHATIEGTTANPIVITKELMDRNLNQMDLFNKVESLNLGSMEVNQIKGKENKSVTRKYRDYVLDFLMEFQVEDFSSMGLSDLENSGLFKLRKGGYAPVEKVGKKMVDIDDGTSWSRVSGELVDLRDYNESLHAKWYLSDKSGRGIGQAEEKMENIINSITMPYGQNKQKYKNHVKAMFDQGLTPGGDLYSGFSGLRNYGLGVGEGAQGFQTVGEPQEVGMEIAKYDGGTFYKTRDEVIAFWLMQGDRIVSHFTLAPYDNQEKPSYTLIFTKEFGIPGGSMTKFLEEVQGIIDGEIARITIQGRTIDVSDMSWEPGPEDEKVMEQDDITYYRKIHKPGGTPVYHAIDSHGQVIFIMKPTVSDIKPVMVNDVSIAGFYAIYLIDKLELDVGNYDDHDSFSREMADETGWFTSRYNDDDWLYMDDNFPITYTQIDWDNEGNDTITVDKEESTMEKWWDDTQLRDTGLDEDYFIKVFDDLYYGDDIDWEDSQYDDDGDENGTTNHYAKGNGDTDTVRHPVSDGTMRITR